MSAPQSPTNPNYPGSPFPPPSGMSTGAKVLIGLGIGCAAVLVVCCGGAVLLTYYVGDYVKKAASDDPAVVQSVAARIAQIDLPAEFRPEGSLDMNVPLSMMFVVYADKSSRSTVVMAQFGEMFKQNQAQMQAQMEQQMRQQGMTQQPMAGTVKSYQETIEVRGQSVVFTFVEGKEQGSGKKRLDAMGVFPNQGKTVMVMISVDAEKYDEARVKKMLKSIR